MGGVRMTWAQYAKLNGLPQKSPRRRKGDPPAQPQLSELESKFLAYWGEYGLKERAPVPQWKFHSRRKWRIDFAWPSIKVGVELHGGEFMKKSGHTTGLGLAKDCEKMRHAQLNGWILLPFTGNEINSDPEQKIKEVIEAINLRS